MTLYPLTTDANQSFYIEYDGEPLQINMRYLPAIRKWIADIVGVVSGIVVNPNMMIFRTYGYPGIIFLDRYDDVGRDLSETVLVYLNQTERVQIFINKLSTEYKKSLGESIILQKVGTHVRP